MAGLGDMARPKLLAGVPFDPRNNALNLVRLMLAAVVIVDHTFPLTRGLPSPHVGPQTLGGWAVIGFFIVSGYLITGSRTSRPLSEYLVHRVARIFPGYLVCLGVIAFGAAPIAYLADHGTLDGFLSGNTKPAMFLWLNFTLHQAAFDVSGTPADIPYPAVWDGALWSLWYEFMCYLVVGFAFCFAAVRRHSGLVITIGYAASVVVMRFHTTVLPYVDNSTDVYFFIHLLPFFLAGAVLFHLRQHLRYSIAGAVLAAGVAFVLIVYVPVCGSHLAAPFLGYLLLWVGTVLPCPALIRREDISYGVYIYGFVIQQCLVLLGLRELPIAVFAMMATALTVIPASLSWILVEHPALRRARGQIAYPWLRRRMRPRPVAQELA
ncbi:MAG: acyltransferase [Bifidobacteriaceae bacterium]|jgi:peptidoglycan/LPS O-acetylase OafA/YrhL|nr:acyltransferase [Bifidobacteriaceae bacterium]